MTDVRINGAAGEGGGQIFRTALTLSMVTGLSVQISNIRANRSRPGLMRQHLAAVRAAKEISNAEVSGDELGSCELSFKPGAIRAGTYEFRIGSAGSTTLLMQTVLPALALAEEPSIVEVHGGTHNGMAPSVDFCELTWLPLLKEIGLNVTSDLVTHGFYPNGGGVWRTTIQPWTEASTFSLMNRGKPRTRCAVAKSSGLQPHVAERELARVAKKLGWNKGELVAKQVSSPGPGNIVSLRCEFEHVTETFESVGALGLSAEQVAGRAVRDAKRYLAGSHAAGEYLADQLLLPLVLGRGGEYTTAGLSEHCRTNMALIDHMLGASHFEVSEAEGRTTIQIPNGLAYASRSVGSGA